MFGNEPKIGKHVTFACMGSELLATLGGVAESLEALEVSLATRK